MPNFQSPEQPFPNTTEHHGHPLSGITRPPYHGKRSEVAFYDNPFSDVPALKMAKKEEVGQRTDGPSGIQDRVCTSDRNELIERIKRGESPTWVPSQTLQEEYSKYNGRNALSPAPNRGCRETVSLLRAADVEDNSNVESSSRTENLSPPSEIKRPRSALHAGDFNKDSSGPGTTTQQKSVLEEPTEIGARGITGTLSRHSSSNSSNYSTQASPPFRGPASNRPDIIPSRSRAPSLNSHLANFVAKAPTTPLIQQSNNTDLDFSPIDRSISPSKSNRRHTLPPQPLHDADLLSSSHASTLTSTARQSPFLHRESAFPHQKHRPRRSLTTTWSLQASCSPQRPAFLRSRRQSLSSEASPLQNASMVGSYEESILRGWMSTAPSKPLDFTAQIGVLGKANCKPKCPAHVTVPFPAVYYSWNGGTGRKLSNIDDEPSPYVGHIDLQQLPTPAESKKARRSRSKSPSKIDSSVSESIDIKTMSNIDLGRTCAARKSRRRASPAVSDLQGGYRIPQKGQLQIVIKNPNKTAVKLFLVPYDLEDMQPGTKTFIRQRCYSADPVIDGIHSVSSNQEPNASVSGSKARSKPVLRYLIHVNICSPSNGRFYLHQHIRVVFANRVPDNKEQLQTEIHLPQPRYSVYNLSHGLSRSISSPSSSLAREKAYRRRSSGFGAGHEGVEDRHPGVCSDSTSYPFMYGSTPPPPVPGIPSALKNRHSLSARENLGSGYSMDNGEPAAEPVCSDPFVLQARPSSSQLLHKQSQRPNDVMDIDSPSNSDTISIPRSSQPPLTDMSNEILQRHPRYLSFRKKENAGTYGKLNKGDAGYGGRPSTPEPGEGLLARKLKGLDVQRNFEAMNRERGHEEDGRKENMR
ncbi:MAG: hypothetical protein Q9219_007254 [cf. Caloplaca sp. 3 TL-2023]